MGHGVFSGYGLSASENDVKKIIAAAQDYDAVLNDRVFLIAFGTGHNSSLMELFFGPEHFIHLVGIDGAKTRFSAKELFERAADGTLKTDDINYSLSTYFRKKMTVAKRLGDFGSVITHVSKIDHSSSNVNGDVWVSGNHVNFALGAMMIRANKMGPITYIPTSLQRLNKVALADKSASNILPISAVLSRKSDDLAYGKILYLDECLTSFQKATMTVIMNSYGDIDKLRDNYPAITDELLGPRYEPGRATAEESLDDLNAIYDFVNERSAINKRREEIERNP